MTPAEIRTAVLASLAEAVPGADPSRLDPARPFRDQLDLDSIDFLNFVLGLDQRCHVAVPETDYGKIATVDGAVGYITGALASPPSSA